MRELERWRRTLLRGGLSEEQRAELDDHLACSIRAHRDAGANEEESLRRALDELGHAADLVHEFRKADPTMTSASKLAGVLLSLSFFALAAGSGAPFGVFVSIPALLLVVGLVAGGWIASFGPKRVVRTLAVGIGARAAIDGVEREELARVAQRGYRLAWASGGLGALTAVIQMLASVDDPRKLGPAAALCLLSLLYGALLAELFFGNLHSWVTRRACRPAEARIRM